MKRRFLSLLITVIILILSFASTVSANNEDIVLYDNNNIKITYQDYTINRYGTFSINLLIENNSSEYICVQTRNASINDFMIDALMSSDIQVGKKAYANISFNHNHLKKNYISIIYDIQFSFHIFNEETWDTIDDSKPINLYSDGIKLNNGISADTRPVTKIYDKDNIIISYIDYIIDDNDDLYVNFLIENNSFNHICIQARNESINGFMIDAIMSDKVQVNKKAYISMRFLDYELKENRITSSINEIDFSLHIFNYDTWKNIDDTEIYKIANGYIYGSSIIQNTDTVEDIALTINTSTDNSINVTINGEKIYFDVQPMIIDGRTLAPMRTIFEKLGASVDWNADTQTVTSIKGDTKISLTIGDNMLYINDIAKTLDVPAILSNNRTLVPVRAISEAFSCSVEWDNDSRTVIILDEVL